METATEHPSPPPETRITTITIAETTAKRQPKRFIRNQIPSSILENPSLNAAISLLPSNYNFEIHKSIHRINSLSSPNPRVALQLPEGLLMYSLTLSDIFRTYAAASAVFVLADVTYGACCVEDLAAASLGADILIHYGHSCLVPNGDTVIPCLYVFVEIGFDVRKLCETVVSSGIDSKSLAIAGTIQFSSAIRSAKVELEGRGFKVLVPQSKPLSPGEVLGCTAPKVSKKDLAKVRNLSNSSLGGSNDSCSGIREEGEEFVIVFVADGRFHLEAFMIANPQIKAYRYDPYLGRLFLEEYDHVGMRNARRKAVEKAREAKNWGVVLGTLGRQGNPRILDRLEQIMEERGMSWTVVLMSEISPARIKLFENSVDAWIQIACPRLSIDWGEAFERPLLTPFEADVALGLSAGWWEKNDGNRGECVKADGSCGCDGGPVNNHADYGGDYPMDYYAQDGGDWNSSYMKGKTRPSRRSVQSIIANGKLS